MNLALIAPGHAADIPAPRDIPYPGALVVDVDASDTERRIISVHETLAVDAGPLVLLFPEWLPGTHGPNGAIDRLAGLQVMGHGARIEWLRDTLNPFAFHLVVPAGVSEISVDFNVIEPVGDGEEHSLVTTYIERVQWVGMVLYPAGFDTRNIQVSASLALPNNWSFASALIVDHQRANRTYFSKVALVDLFDSPVMAARTFRRIDLDPEGRSPVFLDIASDRVDQALTSNEQEAAHRALVQQAYRLFGSHHFDHYDFLLSVSDTSGGIGLEHHQSSEDGAESDYFSDWNESWGERGLLPHEFVHSWNGKYRRPADLTTQNLNVPMQDTLLWVYEGQTDYWGNVLTVRSGLNSPEQMRETIAEIAADADANRGREWRTLQDTTNQGIFHGARITWPSWQRSYDYYREMDLVWLDVDSMIREQSGDTRSLDNFAKLFFGGRDSSHNVVTYTFADVVATLNQVQPYDWASYLRGRLDTHSRSPIDALTHAGWRLVYSSEPNASARTRERYAGGVSFRDSIGFNVSQKGKITAVRWHGPAFEAHVAPGVELVAVNGRAFKPALLADAIDAARQGHDPIDLLIKDNDLYRTVHVEYHGGLRYPHLERIPGTPDRLSAIMAPLT